MSAIAEARSETASMANVVAAISASSCAIASCLPIGWPHWTRSFDQTRQTSRQRLANAAQEAGSVSRPVFKVTRASFRPRPSASRRFSRGTRTFVKRMTPFSIARSPMKWQRVTTSTPGQSRSTMNAEIFFVSGCFAMTT